MVIKIVLRLETLFTVHMQPPISVSVRNIRMAPGGQARSTASPASLCQHLWVPAMDKEGPNDGVDDFDFAEDSRVTAQEQVVKQKNVVEASCGRSGASGTSGTSGTSGAREVGH